MRIPLVAIASLALAGCLGAPAAETDPAAEGGAPGAGDAALAEPVVHEWAGFVLASDAESPTHVQPTEQALFPVFKEGFLFDVKEVPQAMEVALEWEGAGEMMIMLHSHKAHGSNAYVEHVTALDGENPKCLRVPAPDLAEGEWQVMVHSQGMTQVPFTLKVALAGGEGAIVTDAYHGHWLQDGAFEVEAHEIEPCGLAPSSA